MIEVVDIYTFVLLHIMVLHYITLTVGYISLDEDFTATYKVIRITLRYRINSLGTIDPSFRSNMTEVVHRHQLTSDRPYDGHPASLR